MEKRVSGLTEDIDKTLEFHKLVLSKETVESFSLQNRGS